jgi:hypothetical protein
MGMKRFTIILGICAVLAIPTTSAAGGQFGAKRGGDAQVHFIALARNGKIVGVKRFVFRGLQTTCDQGTVSLTNKRKPLPRMRVRNHAFHGDFSNQSQSQHIEVEGLFRQQGTRAAGTLRVRGDFTVHGTSYTGCDSGVADWHVKQD